MLAAAAASAAAVRAVPVGHATRLQLVLMLGLLVEAELVSIRYYYGEHTDTLQLVEAVLAPLFFAGSGRDVVGVVAAGLVLIGLLRRRWDVKGLFNLAQWVLASAVGALVFAALRHGTSPDLGNLAALVLAILAANLVNQLAFSGVLWIVTGHPLGWSQRTRVKEVLLARLLTAGVGIAFGLLLTAGFAWQPWVVVAGVAPFPLLHWASRGYAAARADRIRLRGLQRATHALVSTLDNRQALAGFLAEIRGSFEVRAVELVLFDADPPHVHTCTGRVSDGYGVTRRAHPLADQFADLREPVRVSRRTAPGPVVAALDAAGCTASVVAPLLSNGRVRGLLFLHDRIGLEGFEEGELAVAAALAAELVGFLQRSDLIRAVLDERRKLAEIVEHTSDGLFTLDEDGVVRSWNSALSTITGYGPADMVGHRHVGVLRMRTAAGADVLLEHWPARLTDLPAEVQVLSASGDVVWLSCSYSVVPASEDRSSALVVVARNVTRARELDRLKEDFVAVVSHELRTPLVGIRGWAQTLLSRGERLTPEQRQVALQAMLGQAQRLEQLVLNILETSRIEASSGQPSRELVDVPAAVTRVVDEAVAARPGRVVRLRQPDRPMLVHGSAVWLERALANLIGNAVKYSPDEEPVDVGIAAEDGEIVVRITDRGPGIAKEDRERVFERFERLEQTSTQTGTGLGLYIARQLVRAMGGSITVDSVAGVGSTFSLRLPVAPTVDTATTGGVRGMPSQRDQSPPALTLP